MTNLKNSINYIYGSKTNKKRIKRIGIEIEIQNKFYFWLSGEIEKTN
jgi:hypothetical protein